MPEPVERYDPVGVDYGWIMQVTFVLTIVIGAPLIAIASSFVELPTWDDRVQFAISMGAVLWFCIAIVTFVIAYRRAATNH